MWGGGVNRPYPTTDRSLLGAGQQLDDDERA